eukprot:CCRYP_001417-RB/>CCRYP_001417-RB protein AED:0.48 eAED:0.48 QI:0/-1/0/1/-1/0/1/0/32
MCEIRTKLRKRGNLTKSFKIFRCHRFPMVPLR